MQINPFTLRNYIGAEFFCDRESELHSLTEKFESQRYTTLIANRKMGKTGLIYRLFDHISSTHSEAKCLYIDLYETKNIEDFIRKFSEEIATVLYSRSSLILKNFKNIFRSVHPTVTFDSLTGTPQVEFGFRNNDQKVSCLKDIFNFLQHLDQYILIAFDEFQQIATYPEHNMEEILRTYVQQMKKVNFIFAGSSKHVMMEMFMSAKRPFYNSTDHLYLGYIPVEKYGSFITEKMSLGKKTISDDALRYIMDFTRVHTYYVQSICNRLFQSNIKNLTLENVQESAQKLLDENEGFYFGYKSLLPDYQWKLLIAIAKEGGASQISSRKFIDTYHLNTQGTVQRAIKALLDKEMVFIENEKYYVQDVFFSRWLEQRRF